ncbi:MAG: cyclic nucleotide-binding domain-containing protein [Candidatus Nitricoxidivorans perseverans]|uniref:Cyclic nucleotide-binding domain-containing protein n=1 Tax=Candidatus Nitricoxidivorans perseverans TaxID=2975601 RepID=A0AA49FL41_9PROT|nr:MAG: cyclic nucleotide-binding domain-containing protein [Candidatus Nitricoxidivorans perseverans]
MTVDAALLEKLSRCQPLASLGPESLRELAPLCHSERITRNLDPFRLRDWEGQVVYLTKGELKLDFADGSAALLVGGTGEALLPLGQGEQKPVSSKAVTDVELLRFDEDTLDILVTWDQMASPGHGTAAESDGTDWRTMSGIFAARNLTRGVFSALPPAHIETLLGRFQRIRAKRGETIIRQGGAGDYYYVIERGRCLVTREVAGSRVDLAELKAGDAFGEEALVSDTTRNATVAMKTDGVLLRLSKTDFVDLLREPLMRRVSPVEAQRRVAAGAVWLDVRFPAEYQHDGLPGAINIPLNEVRRTLPMLDPKKEYIVYCQTGRRSSAAAFLFSQRGIRAALLDGGLRALFAAPTGGSR